MLITEKLHIGFKHQRRPRPIRRNVNLSVEAGELVALLGHNGAGKSTLLRSISGQQTPLSGTVKIQGRSLQAYPRLQLAQTLSVVSTDSLQMDNITVYDLVAFGRYPYTNLFGRMSSHDRQLIRAAIDAVGLTDYSHRHLLNLSDGERQKALIARSLAQDTPLIILDEPTAFLDAGNRFDVIALLRRLTREQKKAVVFSTHEVELALNYVDKLWLMRPNGESIEGTPDKLLKQGALDHLFQNKGIHFRAGEDRIRLQYPEIH